MKFGFVARYRAIWPVDLACEALGVSRSGFYSRLTGVLGTRNVNDAMVGLDLRTTFLTRDGTYGARRVRCDIAGAGYNCGRRSIEPLMRIQALRARGTRTDGASVRGKRPAAWLHGPMSIPDEDRSLFSLR
ncbi:MAG: IS3 family transposase [Gemmatimonadaceae bacterium]